MSYRLQRLAGEMQKSLSEIINYRLKDPRLSGMISVLEVAVTKDLKYAKVRISVYGDKQAEAVEALNASAGFVRKEMAAMMRSIRTMPQFSFILDTSIEYSEHINKLLDEIKKDETK
ncbi:MAG: 30S ribosome-binding factor RbfA [Firmicutes bacterium]|nr:30S ribosome-binding factor RbfA [Bacillota bacterium]